MIRALLFDAAGTLIEPAEPVAEVYSRAAAALGNPVDPAAIKPAFIRAFTSLGDPAWRAHPDGDTAERAWWQDVVGSTFGYASGSAAALALFEVLFAHYADPAAWRVFPEVPEVLAAARDAGFLLAVVSNFDRRLHGILAGHGLEFHAVITSADAACRKPRAEIFETALSALKVAPSEALHAGDSIAADVEGARAAGIAAFHLDRPRNDLRDFLNTALQERVK
ncbi:HAD-IIIA family hydrolase [Haloferula sp. BvORR071]|uniref:HAD-IIIA family hydrolase n=1 Tax=Haloferula sp. BvORR071 TaxID=1396141 RepID=UPI002240FE8B|nr:HAD-IIIA family hydrolase [Haloferula sp. BvORR071]